MVEVVWTDFAIKDLDDIGEYIAKESERYAQAVVQNLFESTEVLGTHPKAGRIVPEFNKNNLRELIRAVTVLFTEWLMSIGLTFLPFTILHDYLKDQQVSKERNNSDDTPANDPSDAQFGRFPEGGIRQVCMK